MFDVNDVIMKHLADAVLEVAKECIYDFLGLPAPTKTRPVNLDIDIIHLDEKDDDNN